MSKWIDVATLDGTDSFAAYVSGPDDAKAAIVVIQEIFGVNPGIRAKVDRWAELGYKAIAPDMFWRLGRRKETDPDIPEQLNEAFGLMNRFDPQLGVHDIEATIRAVRDLVGGGKVGVVGFCLGGRMAYLAATRTDADASVAYYGGGIDQLLGESNAIGKPVMLHFAEDDSLIGPEARAAVHDALDDNRHITILDYPGVDHGFATTSGKRRNDTAARLADQRTEAFFAEHLL